MNFNFRFSSPLVHWTDFADPELLTLIKHTMILNEKKFVDSTVTTGEEGYRKSGILWHYDYPELYAKWTARIEQVLPQVKEQMGDYSPQCPHTNIEMQMVNHFRNGDLFRNHIDNGARKDEMADVSKRRISYTYYFYPGGTERKFSGGELLLNFHNGTKTIDPIEGHIVFFPSHLYHEVTPIHSPTEKFLDGRGSITGWVWF